MFDMEMQHEYTKSAKHLHSADGILIPLLRFAGHVFDLLFFYHTSFLVC